MPRRSVAARAVPILAAVALPLAAVTAACSSTPQPDRSASSDPTNQPSRGTDMPTTESQSGSEPGSQAESRSWTGFGETNGLEVVAVDESQGIDRLVRIALRGPAGEIDRALAAAAFNAAFRPGVKVFEPALGAVDLATLTDPSTAEDRWVNAEGRSLTRKVVRGRVDAEGTELIHVWAFTT